MRTFVAIPLRDRLKQQLAALQFPADAIRWQPARQLHITLRFLGEVPGSKTAVIAEALAAVSAAPFRLSLQWWGTFPEKGRPRVIWIGVAATEPLLELQRAVEQVCVSCDMPPEERNYIPHITMGRVRSNADISRDLLEDRFGDAGLPADHEAVTVDAFTLYESRSGREGVTYHPLKKYPLTG